MADFDVSGTDVGLSPDNYSSDPYPEDIASDVRIAETTEEHVSSISTTDLVNASKASESTDKSVVGEGNTEAEVHEHPNDGSETEEENDDTEKTGATVVVRVSQDPSGNPIRTLAVNPPNLKRKCPKPKPKSPIADPHFMCEHCGKSWSSRYKLRNHLRVHTKEKPFKCGECDARFTQKYDCERHQKAHFGEVRTYDCEFCGRSLASSSSLTKHMTIHTGIKKFKCGRCGKAFPTNGDLTKHIRIHTGEKPYTCDVCGRAFAESSSRNRHRMTHTGEKPHKCQFCFECFLRTNDLKRHVERRHSKGESSYQAELKGQSANVSDNVDVPVYDVSELRSGKVSLKEGEVRIDEVMGDDGEVICVVVRQENAEQTGKSSDKTNNVVAVVRDRNEKKELGEPDLEVAKLMDTIERVEELEKTNLPGSIQIVRAGQLSDDPSPVEGKSPDSSPGKGIDCPAPSTRRAFTIRVTKGDEEKIVFVSGENQEDISSKDPDTEYMCTTCEETFSDTHQLHDHIQDHFRTDKKKKKRKFKSKPLLARDTHDCPQCDKRYNTQDALIAHMHHHTGPKKDRKYECNVCTWKFPTLYKLTAHMRSHSDVRPFKCPYCDKAYKARGDLRRHVAAHIDPEQAKQYLCSICGASLASTSSLKKHLNIHSGTRNFPCSLCEKSFYSKGDLDKHFRIHTGDKPYKCNVCDRAFAESSTRNSHQRLHSGEKRFECTVCLKKFNRSGDLNRHTRQHTGERRYKCPNCEATFVDSESLTAHKIRFQDQQSGHLQCKKSPLDIRESHFDVSSTMQQREKDLYRNTTEQADYEREIAAGIYVRPEKFDMSSLYSRDKDMNDLYRDKTDMSVYHQREKMDMSHVYRDKEIYDRDRVHHGSMYPRERMDMSNPYYHRPNGMEFTGNASLYHRSNPMGFSGNFDPYERMPVGGPAIPPGQRVFEVREIDNTGGTYRYGFGGTISVVE